MKVLLACPYAWDDAGGVQVHVRELSKRLIDRGHEALVLTPARSAATQPWVHAAGRPIDLPYNASNAPIDPRPWSRARVREEIRRFGPDVVHAHEPLTPSTAMWATLEAGRAPVVATFHSAATRSRLFDIAAPVLRRVAQRLAARIAVSEAAAAFAKARIGGVFEIVPNGVDLSRFESATPADLGPGSKLLFVGRLDQRKGFPTAVAAFARIAPGHPDLHLIVVGDGPDRAVGAALPPEHRDRVVHVGELPNEAVPAYYRACDVYLGSAVGGESFGMVLVEAMAAGLPVVASDIPGYREVLRDGVEGLLVPPRDPAALAAAAERILGDPSFASGLKARGRVRALSYDWGAVVPQIEDIYRGAVGSGPPSLR